MLLKELDLGEWFEHNPPPPDGRIEGVVYSEPDEDDKIEVFLQWPYDETQLWPQDTQVGRLV